VNDILSRDEIQWLIARNNANPDIGRPVYEPWSDNRGNCATQGQLEEHLRVAGLLNFIVPTHDRWTKRLNSAKFRVQPPGKKEAFVVTRPIKGKNGWAFVELNARRTS
jgi:hypothetical protein